MSFFMKKWGGALIRVGALNRDYTMMGLYIHEIYINDSDNT